MIIRIVKMTFVHDKTEQFVRIFTQAQKKIEAFPGCRGVDLCQDMVQSTVFITISVWDSVTALDTYRDSELFKSTWSETKKLFSERPEAWSVNKLM